MLLWWSFAALLLVTWQTTTNVAEARKVSTNAILIQRALHATFAAFEESPWPKSHPDIPLGFSQIHDQCHHLDGTIDVGRIGCCTPSDVKHLYNVLIEDRKLVVFVPSLKEKDTRPFKLPPVQSVRYQKKVNHHLQVEYREGPMDIDKHCTRYFNGTLHFPGRSTVHNVYHACKSSFWWHCWCSPLLKTLSFLQWGTIFYLSWVRSCWITTWLEICCTVLA